MHNINCLMRIFLLSILFANLSGAQVPQTTPSTDSKVLAQQLVSANSNDERRKIIELMQPALTPQFFQDIADIAMAETDVQRKIDALRFALELAHNIDNARPFLRLSIDLGTIFLEIEKLAEAEKTFADARVFLPRAEISIAGRTSMEIAGVYMNFGLYEKSLAWFEEAKKLFEKSQKPEDLGFLAESWRGIGVAYTETDRYSEALQALKESENRFTKVQNPIGLSMVMSDYGVVYDFLQDYSKSQQFYLAAIDLLQTKNPEQNQTRIAIVKVNLALLQTVSLGEYEKALKNLDEAEQVFGQITAPYKESLLARIYGNKAIALRRIGKYEEGLDYSKKIFQYYKGLGDENSATAINTTSELAAAYLDTKRYNDALDKANDAIARAIKVKASPGLWTALTTKGRALTALNRKIEAKQAFDEAITVVEELTDEAYGDEKARAAYFGGFIYPYHYMVELLLEQGDYDGALRYAERSKAKELLGSVQGNRNNWRKGLTESQNQEERELIEKLTVVSIELRQKTQDAKTSPEEVSRLSQRRKDLRGQLEDFRIRLYKIVPDLSLRRVDLSMDGFTKLSRIIPDGKTVGLHYVVTPERVSLFVINRIAGGKIKVSGYPLSMTDEKTGQSVLLTGSELARRVKSFRSFLENEPLGGFNKDASELYNLLLKPAEAVLARSETVVIVPDNVLWELPFQALRDDRQKFFIESHAISYTPSFFALSEMERVRDARATTEYKRALLALGNPDLGTSNKRTEIAKWMGDDLESLPQAETQVKKLGQLFSETVYTRSDATESLLKREAPGAKIIHLAAHGILDNTSPLYSRVVLSQIGDDANREDGMLETWEIMNLNFQSTEMLVLSACESARGELRPGEGIISLMWATFVAGSPSTIASQWKVDAGSTNVLMENFYKNLFPARGAGKRLKKDRSAISKAKAMQRAMKQLLKPGSLYNHPSFWAGFIVAGDAR